MPALCFGTELADDLFMTARDEILEALPTICAKTADGTFTPRM